MLSLATTPQSRRYWIGAGLLFAAGMPAALLAGQINRLFVYLTGDAGHTLADGDAFLGHGVREMRHPPVFPAVTAIVHAFSSDLGAIRYLALLAVAAMPLACYLFVRGRTGSPHGDITAALVFGFAPPTAEAVGYYGVVMLVGIVFAILAMRTIQDWLDAPTVPRAVLAGSLIGATALAHPLGLAWLVQVSFFAGLANVVCVARRPREQRSTQIAGWLKTAPALVAITLVAGFGSLRFGQRLDNDVAFSFDLHRLRTIDQFGFRDNPQLWVGLMLAACVVLPLSAWRGSSGRRSLAVWAFAAGIVPAIDLVSLRSHISYENRQVYLLALPAAVCAGLVVSACVRARVEFRVVSAVAIALAVLGVTVLAADAFDNRVAVALPYYNRVTRDELDAIRWIRDHKGPVIVTSKSDYFYEGARYAWMLEGLARVKAIAPGEGFYNIIDIARRESDDAALVGAGTVGAFDQDTLVAAVGGGRGVRLFVRSDHSWYPVATIGIGREGTTPRVAGGSLTLGSAATVAITGGGTTEITGAPGEPVVVTGIRALDPIESLVRPNEAVLRTTTRQATDLPETMLKRVDGGPRPLASGSQLEFLPAAPGARVRLTTRTSPADRGPQQRTQSYTDSRLLRKRHARWVWAWDEPDSTVLQDLIDRGMRVAFRNRSIVVLSTAER